jgi:hypothetical protein
MKTKILMPLALLALTLAACNTKTPANQGAWTRAELSNVFDLSELGELTFSEDGSYTMIGGKNFQKISQKQCLI